MRRPVKKRQEISPDFKYNSPKVEKFINYVMEDGKKEIARRVVYTAFETVQKKAKVDSPIEVFDQALKNVGPTVEVRSRRVGGANYQVPREVRADRRNILAMRWILEAVRSKKGRPIDQRIADELLAASKGEGEAVAKKNNIHKMADANKAFAHFA